MAFFEVFDWATDLTPWPDPKIDRNPEVGRHAEETLAFVTNTLLPALTDRFGPVPVILGGHFSDNDARLARAFSWCIRNVRM